MEEFHKTSHLEQTTTNRVNMTRLFAKQMDNANSQLTESQLQERKLQQELKEKVWGWHPSDPDLPNSPSERLQGGTPEQAKEYWDAPDSEKDPDEYWRRYYATEG